VQKIRRIDTDRHLLPLAMLDPIRAVDEQLRNLRNLVEDIAGLKVQTTTIQSPMRALLTTGREFLALAEQLDLPVLIHTAIHPGDPWAQVADGLEVAAAFPRVRFDLAHSLRFHAGFLRQAATMDNVWVDSAALLIHCALACVDSPIAASGRDRVDADYTKPASVLEAIHAILGDRYLWGSDSPFMSWCDDDIRYIYSYADEARVLNELPEAVRSSMCSAAPEAWLFGKRDRTT
jgi:predicted TIM-barrel fold metal-dependent hydrolase